MALTGDALTTLATVLDELGLTTDGGAQDARLERYIASASAFIRRVCGRNFERADTIVETRKAFGFTKLYVRRDPIISVASVKLSDELLDPTEYELVNAGIEGSHLYREVGWPWSAARMPGIVQPPAPGQEKRVVEVTYNGGYVTPQQVVLTTFPTRTLPQDLEDACVQLTSSRWQARGRDTRVTAKSYEASGLTYGGVPVPAELAALFEAYTHIVHA